jgi:hypothetical protein
MFNNFKQEINKKYKFIAKPDTWFMEGTEVEVTCLYSYQSVDEFDKDFENNKNFSNEGGLFIGKKFVDEEYAKMCIGCNYKPGEILLDEEGCNLDEFIITKR